jgi:hypothetical protein
VWSGDAVQPALAVSPHFVSASAQLSGTNLVVSFRRPGSASLTLSPPTPPSTFSCLPGQDQAIAEVVYSNVSITYTTNGITEPIPGTFDTGCLLPDVRGACTI